MGPIKKIKYDCRRATFLIEKSQSVRLSLRERLALRIHLSGCSVCRLFQQQSQLINRALRRYFTTSGEPVRPLDQSIKQEMQEKINQRRPK